jgi:hypothetical protein
MVWLTLSAPMKLPLESMATERNPAVALLVMAVLPPPA